MKNFLKEYLKYRPLFYSLIRPREANLFRSLVPFKKPVMDFGCGDGFFSDVFYGDLGKIDVGVDIDKTELEKAKKIGIYKKLVVYRKDRLPFPDNYFSTVISNCVMEHVDNLDHDLREINRVLKPKGRFFCTVMTDKWEEYLFGGRLFGDHYKTWMRNIQVHPNLLSKKEWDETFKNLGFGITKTVGYLNKRSSAWMDILHYVSIGSLISYKLFKKWVLFPERAFLIPKILFKSDKKNIDINRSATLFYILIKK